MSSESLEGLNVVVKQPALSDDGPKSNKPWTYLSRFELTSRGYDKINCPVYANGRQQIPVEIIMEARDEDGVVVDVNHSGLYLYLCLYNDIDVFPTELGRSGTQDSRYVYQWPLASAEAGQEATEHALVPREGTERVQVVEQYVTATKVGAYKLAVRCRSPAKVVFATNTPNPPPGKFDSWLIVDARETVSVPLKDVALTVVNAVTTTDFDVDVYYVYFVDSNLRVVATEHNPDYPPNNQHYSWMHYSNSNSHYCYRKDEQQSARYWSCYAYQWCDFPINERAGAATLSRCTTKNVPNGKCGNWRQWGVYLGLINQYGNVSYVGVEPISHGNEIRLVDAATKELGYGPDGPACGHLDEMK